MIASTGVDLVEVARVKDMAEKHGDKFLKRVFTPREITYCSKRKYKYEHFAARFAAKEAVMKTLEVGLGSVGLKEIEVVRSPRGNVRVRLAGKARERADALDISAVLISMSHTRDHAIAVAVAETERSAK
jgi:holo-[acyl-carrier protein] synthase